MKTALVNEDHNTNGVEWSVSLDGYNTSDTSQTVICANGIEAFKLKNIVDDLKEKLSFVCDNLLPRLDEMYESETKLALIIEDIKTIYL